MKWGEDIIQRQYQLHKKFFYISTAGILSFLIYMLCYHIFQWKFYIPFSYCGFHDILHLYCPGCGGTRAIDVLFSFRFMDSFLDNPIVLYVAGVGIYYYIAAFYTFVIKRDGKIYYKLPLCLLWIALGIVIGFFVLRNVLLIVWKIDYLGDLTAGHSMISKMLSEGINNFW